MLTRRAVPERLYLPHPRGASWPGCRSVQGAEPEDGQEGVDRDTHPGGCAPGHPCLGLRLSAAVLQPHLTGLRTLELGELFDNLVGGDFGKACF